jgi:hypothetical protein
MLKWVLDALWVNCPEGCGVVGPSECAICVEVYPATSFGWHWAHGWAHQAGNAAATAATKRKHLLFLVENEGKQIALPHLRNRNEIFSAFFISPLV